MRPEVSVIIPTTCEAHRAQSLRNAIHSAETQEAVSVRVIVVVNGTRYDRALYDDLRRRRTLTLHYLEAPSLPAARRHGRRAVCTEFFAFIDDDDEFLPGAFHTRALPLLCDGSLDVVVTNGFDFSGGRDSLWVRRPDAVNRDPVRALLAENWLASAGGFFRTSSISEDFFRDDIRYFEWTVLAFRLAVSARILFLNIPTFRINDTPASLSKTDASRLTEPDFIKYLMSFDVSDDVRRLLRRKLLAASHDLSTFYLRNGDRAQAWRCHLKSLFGPGGLKYLRYTGKFLLQW